MNQERPGTASTPGATRMSRNRFLRYAVYGAATVGAAGAVRAAADSNISGTKSGPRRTMRIAPPTNGVDDRAVIQQLLDEGPGEILFRAGQRWTVDSVAGTGGLSPRSGTRIIVEDEAVIAVKPNNQPRGRLIDIGRDGPVDHVIVEGSGTLLGDVETHIGESGEWGHLVHVTNGSSDVSIIGPLVLRQAWGDGIYIGDGPHINFDVLVDGVIVDDCRREGIAAFFVDGCSIRNCRVMNIGSTANAPRGPGSGIDAEPNDGQRVDDLTIENNWIHRTAGCGIYVSANPGPITGLTVRNNEVIDCGLANQKLTTYQVNGIHIAAIDHPTVAGNIVIGSGYDGDPNGASGQIYMRSVTNPILTGGRLLRGLGRGLFMTDCHDARVNSVILEENRHQGIVIYQTNGAIVEHNKFLNNVESTSSSIEHILIQSSTDIVLRKNRFEGENGSSWLKIEHPSDRNTVEANVGSGKPPPSIVTDEGVATVTIDGGIAVTE